LVEHAKGFTWNENKLKKLYNENRSWLKKYDGIVSDTWFMDDNMVLRTTFSARDLKITPELSISVPEEKDDCAMIPIWITTKR
jgi:hypothetical protein